MKPEDISAYWQAYPDLTELWAKGVWDDAGFTAHYKEHGQPEGRSIPQTSLAPQNWSDWLYFSEDKGEPGWWWKKGILDTGLYHALIYGPKFLNKGDIEHSEKLQKAGSLSQQALAQIAQNARDFPGEGPLGDILRADLQWAAPKAIGVLQMRAAIKSAFPAQYGYVIILPWLESGGAELVGSWHYLAAKKLGLNPLIILGDKPNVTTRFADQGFNILNLPELFEAIMAKPYSDLSRDERMEVLTSVIEGLQPNVMQLIHSYIGYSALTAPATKKRIRAACKTIFVSAFCPHIHPTGNYDGYFRDIPDLMDVVDRFVFDNDWYMGEMANTYALQSTQAEAIKYPVDSLPAAKPLKKQRKKVLWASRFDSQKNPKIVAEIAAQMPDTEFLMYGRQVMGDDQIIWEDMPENVTHGGEFFNIDELPIKECFAFLYTSKFDGTPNILLEIGSRGLPIVTPNIGGIAGYLGDRWQLYVDNPEDIEGFVRQLKKLRKNAKLGQTLARKQRSILKSERSFEAFVGRIKALLLPFTDS